MAADLTVPFAPSCCEGGVCSDSPDSCQPCGCDPKAGWVCAQHREDAMRDTVPAYGIPEYENFATCPPKDGYAGIPRESITQFVGPTGRETGCGWDFIVKDSGKRETYAGGMVRDTTEGKVMYSLIADGPMLKRWAVHLTKGAAKYGTGNWLKAEGDVELRRAKDSAFRHFMQWYYGEVDEDHASAVYFNVNEVEFIKDKMKRDA